MLITESSVNAPVRGIVTPARGRGLMTLALLALLSACTAMPSSQNMSFITRDGHRLMAGEREFRFAGIHAPELHRIENDSLGVCAADPRGWGQYFKWPSAAEQENWIKALTRSGHKAMRVYVLSVATPWDEACGRETHILPPAKPGGPPRLNEPAMVVYDRMIALAHEHNLRLILPFIDHWQWWGGRGELAAFYGETADDFYRTDSQTYAAYLAIIEQVITRKNSVTGRLYKHEPAIMAWETGNELRDSTPEFVRTTAAHIKRLDDRHLVIDGTYLKILPSSLQDPNIDIISNHFYTTNQNNNPAQIQQDLQAIDGKKVYLVGEFGLKDARGMRDIMQTAVHYDYNGARTAGAFVWGFRGRRETGGFYWHKEYTGHYSYHLPGFAENDDNEEREVVALVREAQAQMAGFDTPQPLPVPEAPLLYPIVDPRVSIMWFGSPLGETYRIERAASEQGPWQIIAEGVGDGRNEFDPSVDTLFRDQSARPGQAYFYRVYAANESGESPASNTVEGSSTNH